MTTARIEYTKDSFRGIPMRRAKEVRADRIDQQIEKLENNGAYNIQVKYEIPTPFYDPEKTVVMPRAELDALIAASKENA